MRHGAWSPEQRPAPGFQMAVCPRESKTAGSRARKCPQGTLGVCCAAPLPGRESLGSHKGWQAWRCCLGQLSSLPDQSQPASPAALLSAGHLYWICPCAQCHFRASTRLLEPSFKAVASRNRQSCTLAFVWALLAGAYLLGGVWCGVRVWCFECVLSVWCVLVAVLR